MERTNVEYELKAWAPSEDKLNQLLSDFKKEKTVKFQEDVYFDSVHKELFKHGIFTRIRDNKLIEIKFNPDMSDNRHLDCEETRFDLPINQANVSVLKDFYRQIGIVNNGIINYENGESILQSLGLIKFVTISKKREIYTMPGVEFCVDIVQDLGTFIEIESVNQELSQKYQDWANNEGLKLIPIGYVELYLRKHDFSTYMTGRYLLDEDSNR